MSKIHCIYNPVAGHGTSRKLFAELEALMQARGVEYSVAETKYAGHTTLLAKEAVLAGHGCILSVGGDGTVREVAEAMIGSDIPLGIFPCGTGNDLAKVMRLPKDPEAVLDMLLKGHTRPMDAGTVNGSWFFNVAGLGFDVDVLLNTERYKKGFRGLAPYLMGLFHSLLHMRLRRVRISDESGPSKEFEALVVSICNGSHMGGGMHVAPGADPFDGKFHVCVLHDVSKGLVLRALTRFVKGKHTDMDICKFYTASEVYVESDEPIPLQLDGEVMHTTPARFTIQPGALKVICMP